MGARPSTGAGGSSKPTSDYGGFGGAYAVPPTTIQGGSGGINSTSLRSGTLYGAPPMGGMSAVYAAPPMGGTATAYGTPPAGGTGTKPATSSTTLVPMPAYGVAPFGGNGNGNGDS